MISNIFGRRGESSGPTAPPGRHRHLRRVVFFRPPRPRQARERANFCLPSGEIEKRAPFLISRSGSQSGCCCCFLFDRSAAPRDGRPAAGLCSLLWRRSATACDVGVVGGLADGGGCSRRRRRRGAGVTEVGPTRLFRRRRSGGDMLEPGLFTNHRAAGEPDRPPFRNGGFNTIEDNLMSLPTKIRIIDEVTESKFTLVKSIQ